MASLIVIAGLVYVGLCAWVYATQRAQIYFPTFESKHAGTKVLWIESQGERIKVWVVVRPGPSALLYFGGNAEDVAGNIDHFAAALPDRSLYLVNYRGYGGSSGRPSETVLFADALAVYEHVRGEHPDITVMGRSLGSGVATYLASQRPVARLVLVTAFDSLVNVARAHIRFLPIGLLLRDRYDSARRASAVNAPVLVVIAGEDEIIPRAHAQALVTAFAPRQVQVVVVPGVGHNTLDLSPAYLESVRAFLAATATGGERP
ncbi:MAG: alpha/beta fold hydrolase [Steroidobacteraceae bacterium]